MNKILVLGANGQVGKCLCEDLGIKKFNFLPKSKDQLDIADEKTLSLVINEYSPNIILNCSGYTNVDLAEDEVEKANLINNTSVGLIAKVAEEIDALLIHISTDYVFDGKSKNPYIENSNTNPISIYGSTKLQGEKSIISSGCKYYIIRTSWVFSEYGKNFLKTILELAKSKEYLQVVSDQIGCPTYARDISLAIINLIDNYDENSSSEILHFSGDKECSWYFFAKCILNIAKKQKLKVTEKIHPIKTINFNQKASRPMHSVLSNAKINSGFNIESSNWMNGIEKSINFLIKNYE